MKSKIFFPCIACLGFLECACMEAKGNDLKANVKKDELRCGIFGKFDQKKLDLVAKKTDCSAGGVKDEIKNADDRKELLENKSGLPTELLKKKRYISQKNENDENNLVVERSNGGSNLAERGKSYKACHNKKFKYITDPGVKRFLVDHMFGMRTGWQELSSLNNLPLLSGVVFGSKETDSNKVGSLLHFQDLFPKGSDLLKPNVGLLFPFNNLPKSNKESNGEALPKK